MLQQRKTRKKRGVAEGKHHTHNPTLFCHPLSHQRSWDAQCQRAVKTRVPETGKGERCLTEAEPGEGREKGIF